MSELFFAVLFASSPWQITEPVDPDIAGPPYLQVYGILEIEVRDLDDHVLTFGQAA